MKKKLIKHYLSAGIPTILTIEYRYELFGFEIPITHIKTREVKNNFTGDELELAVKYMLSGKVDNINWPMDYQSPPPKGNSVLRHPNPPAPPLASRIK